MNRRSRRLALTRCVAALALAVAGGHARASKLTMRIAAGSAPVALREFIRQTGLQVLFEFDVIRHYSTQAVNGELDADEALALMLADSGLTYEFVNDRTITVRPRSAASEHERTLPEISTDPLR